MVAYFGWGFTLLFMGLSLMGAWVVAAVVSVALADVAGSGSGSGHGDGRD
jgi:hypothetical protein